MDQADAQDAGGFSSMSHKCHWPTCNKEVPPSMWGCRSHWFTLPGHLRNEIWRTYKAGQEITKTPSAEYLDAANRVQIWCNDYIKRNPGS